MLFQRKMRRLDMRHEIYQFQTVISILREMDRMSVEEIVEWLNRFAVISKGHYKSVCCTSNMGLNKRLNN